MTLPLTAIGLEPAEGTGAGDIVTISDAYPDETPHPLALQTIEPQQSIPGPALADAPLPQVSDITPLQESATQEPDAAQPTEAIASVAAGAASVAKTIEDSAAQFGAALARMASSRRTEGETPSATSPSTTAPAVPSQAGSPSTGASARTNIQEDAADITPAPADPAPALATPAARPNGDQLGLEGVSEAVQGYHPAEFKGMTPGVSTRDQVLAAWGTPAETIVSDDGDVLTFRLDSFPLVEVLLVGDVVEVIRVAMQEQDTPEQYTELLSLAGLEPITVRDEGGIPLGRMYPERGVIFVFAEGSPAALTSRSFSQPRVTHFAVQPLDSQAFVLRAEENLHGPYQQNIADLEYALTLDPKNALAYWLLAEIHLETGQANLAEAAAAKALRLEPTSDAYRLRWAESLSKLGKYDQAVHETRTVLDNPYTPDIVQAQALYLMGRLASMGDATISARAIDFHNKAIELADSLVVTSDTKQRRIAKRLLVDAHLAIAEQVATQEFQNKIESISQWIGRASGLAEDYIATDGGSLELRLSVAVSALRALANVKPTRDPAPWVKEAQETANLLLDESFDTLWQRKVRWDLGVAYHHALRCAYSRNNSGVALEYGEQAIANLAEGAKSRQAVPEAERIVGLLYFHMGAIYAIHDEDHVGAVAWYNKAAPMLNSPVPANELYVPRQEGEVLVSMGVSYWETGEQARAVELTETGAGLMERAVDGGVLERSALGVPYSNLATMHRELGNWSAADNYTALAQATSHTQAAPATQATQATPAPPRASTPTATPAATGAGRQPAVRQTPAPRSSSSPVGGKGLRRIRR